MTIELKNVKINNALSDETLNFSASIYNGGKRIATVANHGHGGPNEYRFDQKATETAFDAFVDRFTENDAEYKFDDRGTRRDVYIAALIDTFESDKWMKRQTKSQILFRIEGDDDGAFRTIKVRNAVERKKATAFIRKKYDPRVIEIHGGIEADEFYVA